MRYLNRIFLVIFIVFLLSTEIGFNAYAYEVPGKIRVGLEYKYKNVTSVPIQNARILVGYEINNVFVPSTELNQGSYAVVTSDEYFVRIFQSYTSYEMAKSYSASYVAIGLNPTIGMINQYEFYIYFGGFGTQQEASAVSAQTGGVVINPSTKRTKLTSGGQTIIVFDNDTLYPQITAAAGDVYINLGERKYRGAIEFNRSSGKITAVNVCGMDEYLYIVVPSEMAAEWPLEALKAQAVAARSYILTRFTKHQDSGYHVCDTSHCQVYLGASYEKERSITAVNQTSGIIAMYDSKPINAVYFGSSGGCTDDSENVWNEYVPYLRSVSDFMETTPKVWTRTFSLAEITGFLSVNKINIGSAVNISVKSSGTSNRILEMTIQGTTGVEKLTKEGIRNFFSSSKDGELASRNFIIQDGVTTASGTTGTQLMDSVFYIQGSVSIADYELKNTYAYTKNVTAQPISDFINNSTNLNIASKSGVTNMSAAQVQGANTVVTGGHNGYITFTGKGNGHGVGMSQYGAKAMAEAGYGYMDILRYYYTGVYFN